MVLVGFEFGMVFEVGIYIVVREEGEDCQVGIGDIEGELYVFVEDEGVDWEGFFFVKKVYGFVCLVN